MVKNEEKQSNTGTLTKQVGLDLEAYNILTGIKNQLINKYKNTRNVTYSDAIREMLKRIKSKKIEEKKDESE